MDGWDGGFHKQFVDMKIYTNKSLSFINLIGNKKIFKKEKKQGKLYENRAFYFYNP